MKDFTAMMGHMKEAYAKMQALQQQVAALEAVGESGAGAVKATVNGKKALLKLQIDPAYLQPAEQETLQDLVVAAVQLAQKAVEEQLQALVKQHTGGMVEDLPFGLGG